MIWRCFATKTSDVREDSRDIAIHCVLQEELWVFACGWYEISAVPFCSLFLSKPQSEVCAQTIPEFPLYSHYRVISQKPCSVLRSLCRKVWCGVTDNSRKGFDVYLDDGSNAGMNRRGWKVYFPTTSVIPNSGNNWAHAFIMVATFYKHGAALQLGPTLQGTHGILCYCVLMATSA